LHFFHHDSGGVWQSDFSSDGCILAVNGTGALQLFQPRQTSSPDSKSRPGSVSMMPSSPLITPISKYSKNVDPFIATLFDLPAIKPNLFPEDKSWDEKQEEARIARERKRYEASINEVTTELEGMRSKVAELLEANDRLPESERIDVHEFELDVEEQQRRVNEGMDKEDDLR